MHKFNRKYVSHKKGLNIVMHQYTEYPKDTYGWTGQAQDKEDWINNNIEETSLFYKYGCFETIENSDDENGDIDEKSAYQGSKGARGDNGFI